MNKVEVFKNELRNYRFYTEEVERLSLKYIDEKKLKGEENINKRYNLLSEFGKKDLFEAKNKYDEVWNAMVGVGAIKYDSIHISVSQEQRDRNTLELIEKYNDLIKILDQLLDECEKRLSEEIQRLVANIKYIDDVLYKLPNEIRNVCVGVYCNGKSYDDISNSNNIFWSASGLYWNVNKELEKLLKREDNQ